LKLLAVVGTKHSGKTTVVECLISGLTKNGLQVGSIKHIHHPDFSMDKEGTNTWRHAQAGSKIVAAVAKNEIAIILKDDPEQTLGPVLDFMTRDGLDIVIVEGLHSSIGKRPDVFKIVTAHDEHDLQERIRDVAPPILAISGIIAANDAHLSGFDFPVVDCRKECSRLVKLVEESVFKTRQ
jgi:molybdopterin-guanine dinucleotide biosynthesis adapter protein